MANPGVTNTILGLHLPDRLINFQLSLKFLFILFSRVVFYFWVVFDKLSFIRPKGKSTLESAHVNEWFSQLIESQIKLLSPQSWFFFLWSSQIFVDFKLFNVSDSCYFINLPNLLARIVSILGLIAHRFLRFKHIMKFKVIIKKLD